MPKKIPKIVKEIQSYKKRKIDYDKEKSISFSQFYMFNTCPHQWYLTYVKKLAPYQPSIHGLFGTAIHETIQKWLDVMYNKTVKASAELNLDELLTERIKKTFKKEKYRNGNESFSSPEELNEFFEDGKNILTFLKKKRGDYFSRKFTYLVGSEIPIVQEVRPGVFFNGYIDLVFYDEFYNRFKIVDLKTSTKGWTDYAKNDEAKIAQILLYKEFFSRQFNIPKDSIEVEYLILKRKIPLDTEFTAKYVQRYVPASGKVKMNKTWKMFTEFLDTIFNQDGTLKDIEFEKIPSLNNCKFCLFNENKYLCNVGIS